MPQTFGLFVVLGAVFGLLAGCCAFVIAYAECRHRFSGKAKRFWVAFQTALVAFLFILLLSAILPWALRFSPAHAPR
jgi:H+/Cl- antiporter ClcA